MKQRFFLPFLLALGLLAAACGGASEVASDAAGDVADAAEEAVGDGGVAEEAAEEEAAEPAEETTTTTEAAETTATEPPAEEEAPAEDGAEAVAVNGQEIYEANCSRCHGDEGQGGRGSNLQGIADEQADTMAAIAQTVNGGGGMPAFGERLSGEEIEATVDYIFATFLAPEASS